MSDYENDSECLEIHFGSRLSISSDSGDNDELDEEYHLLIPSPIPADIIIQNSIYRPPSPKNEVPEYNLPAVSGSITVSTPRKITKNMQAVAKGKQQQTKSTEVKANVGTHLTIAINLIDLQHIIYSYSAKLSLGYLELLEQFRINLDCFGNSLEGLKSEKSVAESSKAAHKVIATLENSIENFSTLLSNLYAFIISQYLMILSEAKRFKRSKVTSIIIKTLDLIENIGDINEIRKKIHLRIFKKIDDPKFSRLIPVALTNDEIVNELKILFPETGKKRRRRRRIRTKKSKSAECTVFQQKSSCEVETDKNNPSSISPKIKTAENTKGCNLLKSQVPLAKSNSMKLVSSIMKVEVQNFKNSATASEEAAIEEKNLSIANSPSKRKRRKKNKTEQKSLCIGSNSLEKVAEVYKPNNKSEDQKIYMEIGKENIQNSKTEMLEISDAKSKIRHEVNCHINESGYQTESEEMKILKCNSPYNSQLSRNENVPAAMKNAADEQKNIYNFDEVATRLMNTELYPQAMTHSLLRLVKFSNIKVISLLNTIQYSTTNFEEKYSVAAFESLKDCLKILHYIITFNDLLLKVSSADKLVKIEKYFLPNSRICQAHLYAYIISQSIEFIMSLKSRKGENEAKLLYSELLELLKIFGTPEEIHQKLKHRNDNIYIELAQQVCSILPLSYISASNEEIVGNIESLRKSTKKPKIKQTDFIIHHLKLPTATLMPKCNEFDNLHFDVKKIEILVKLQNYIADRKLSEFQSIFENMNTFCVTLKTLEEFKKKTFEVGSFVHAFLHNMDSILSFYVLRILVSQFYSFIFFMFSIHISASCEITNKGESKVFRHNLLKLMSSVCTIEQIPEKLRYRNDDFFMKYTKATFNLKGNVIIVSSKHLCKNISSILMSNRDFLEKSTEGYISSLTSFKRQISNLKDELFNICIEGKETEKLTNFKTLANDIILRNKIETKPRSPLKIIQVELNGSNTNLDLSTSQIKSVLEPETKKFSNDSEKEMHSSENIVDNKTFELDAKPISIPEELSEMKVQETDTLIFMKLNMKAINVLEVLQYIMDTFEIIYSKPPIKVLNDCINILKSIFNFNNLFFSSCSAEFMKGMGVHYISISELIQSHSYAYILYFCCLHIKTSRSLLIQEKLYLQLNEIIEALGTTEDIYNKLKYRDDHLYLKLAQNVCSIIPGVCSPSSNKEILEEISQIRNSLESQDDSFEFEIKNINEDLLLVVNAISSQKFHEIENLQLDLNKIEILTILQDNINHSINNSLEENSLFENMKNFLVILEQLEKQEESEPDIGSFVQDLSTNLNKEEVASLFHELSANLNKVLNRHVLRIFVSQFYSFYLFIFLKTFDELPLSVKKNIMDCFHIKLFKYLILICPLEKIPEKLQFRNDTVYSKYMKSLLNRKGVLVDKSSEQILNEALDIFKALAYLEKFYSGFDSINLITQLDEFDNNTWWKKKLINTSLEEDNSFGCENILNPDLNILPRGDTEQNLDNKKVESSVKGTISRSERNFEVVQYLQKCSKSEVRDIIIQIMNNQLEADIALNSVMRKIEYSIIKAITVLNILQYSFDTFEKKLSIAAFASVLDCHTLLHSIGKFTDLLSVSSSFKLKEIKKSYAPILEICQAYFYAYILSACCEFIRLFKSDTNQIENENELYLKVLNMVKKFGTRKEIYKKLKYRNDNCYIEFVQKSFSVIPSTLMLPNNDYILRNIPYLEDSQKNNKNPFEFIISKNPGVMKMVYKLKQNSREYSEFECTQLDLKKLKLLTELQHDINFHDRFPTDFYLVFQNMINFFVNLKSFEDNEIKLIESGNFVDKFSENSDITLSVHILRILVAHFYSFIFTACLDFLKKLPELVSKNKVSFYHDKLINLFSSNCPIDKVFEKIQFRNDIIYSKYIGDVLKMKVIEIGKSYDEIHSEVFDVVKTNQILSQNNSI